MTPGMVCVVAARHGRVYVRPQLEPDGGFSQVAATPLTHEADVLDIYDECRRIEEELVDPKVAAEDTAHYLSVLGVALIPGNLEQVLAAAGMVLRAEAPIAQGQLPGRRVKLGVWMGCALVVDDGESLVCLMGCRPSAEEVVRAIEVQPIAPSSPLRVVPGGVR